MKVALLGAGRIGRLHARLLSATPGRRRRRHRRRRPGPRRRGRGRGRRHRRADHRRRPRRRRGRRHRGGDRTPTPSSSAPSIAAWPADVLREAARGRPRRHARRRRRDRAQRRPVPARLPAPLRPRLPRGAPAGRDRASSGRSTRSASPATTRRRRTSRTSRLGRPVPRLLHPRLRYPALADRPRGRGGLCRWRRPGLPDVRQVRRRRHRRGDPAHDRRTVRRPDLGPPRSARLRHPGRAVRLGRLA